MPFVASWSTIQASDGSSHEICRQPTLSDTCWMCCAAMLLQRKNSAHPNFDMIEELLTMARAQSSDRLNAIATMLKAMGVSCEVGQLSPKSLEAAQGGSSPQLPVLMGVDLTAGPDSGSKHLVLVEGPLKGHSDHVIVCDPANGLVQSAIGLAYSPTFNVSGKFDGWVLEAHFPATAQGGFKDQ